MFCGCGGLSQGFKDAGFEVLFGVDHDIPSLITYDANFGIGKGKNIDLFKKDFLKKFSQELNNS